MEETEAKEIVENLGAMGGEALATTFVCRVGRFHCDILLCVSVIGYGYEMNGEYMMRVTNAVMNVRYSDL